MQSSFARAVDLNPASVAALNDLGEYDVAAPFIVGGGADKARALATRMMPNFPVAAHRLLARTADAENDLPTAEAEFKRAVGVQGSPEAWIDLAQFYQTHARVRTTQSPPSSPASRQTTPTARSWLTPPAS